MSNNSTDELYGVMLQFSHDILEAINKAGIKPAPNKLCVVMVITGPMDEDGGPCDPPVGCSLNYIKDKNKWELFEQAAEIEHIGKADIQV